MENSNKSCFMCGETNCDGIIINGEMICRKCEDKIVNTKAYDKDYDIYKDKVKVILFNDDDNDEK